MKFAVALLLVVLTTSLRAHGSTEANVIQNNFDDDTTTAMPFDFYDPVTTERPDTYNEETTAETPTSSDNDATDYNTFVDYTTAETPEESESVDTAPALPDVSDVTGDYETVLQNAQNNVTEIGEAIAMIEEYLEVIENATFAQAHTVQITIAGGQHEFQIEQVYDIITDLLERAQDDAVEATADISIWMDVLEEDMTITDEERNERTNALSTAVDNLTAQLTTLESLSEVLEEMRSEQAPNYLFPDGEEDEYGLGELGGEDDFYLDDPEEDDDDLGLEDADEDADLGLPESNENNDLEDADEDANPDLTESDEDDDLDLEDADEDADLGLPESNEDDDLEDADEDDDLNLTESDEDEDVDLETEENEPLLQEGEEIVSELEDGNDEVDSFGMQEDDDDDEEDDDTVEDSQEGATPTETESETFSELFEPGEVPVFTFRGDETFEDDTEDFRTGSNEEEQSDDDDDDDDDDDNDRSYRLPDLTDNDQNDRSSSELQLPDNSEENYNSGSLFPGLGGSEEQELSEEQQQFLRNLMNMEDENYDTPLTRQQIYDLESQGGGSFPYDFSEDDDSNQEETTNDDSTEDDSEEETNDDNDDNYNTENANDNADNGDDDLDITLLGELFNEDDSNSEDTIPSSVSLLDRLSSLVDDDEISEGPYMEDNYMYGDMRNQLFDLEKSESDSSYVRNYRPWLIAGSCMSGVIVILLIAFIVVKRRRINASQVFIGKAKPVPYGIIEDGVEEPNKKVPLPKEGSVYKIEV